MISKEQLEKLYNKDNLKQREIAEKLNIKLTDLQNLLVKYGIKKNKLPKNHFKNWTKKQDDFLILKFGSMSYEEIGKSKIIQRTAESVRARASKLELGSPIFHEDFITKTFIVKNVRVDANTLREWIERHGLKAEKTTVSLKQKITRISLSDFWNWAKENTKLINWNKFKEGNLGVEPYWTKKVRREYSKTTPRNEGKEWTNEQDTLLDSYYRTGKYIGEIADILGRSTVSIDRRLTVICTERRKKRWTKEEEKKVKEMIKKGLGTHDIAVNLKRSYKSVEMFRTRYINNNKSLNI